MTTTIRARVWKFPDWDVWCASAYADSTATASKPPLKLSSTVETHPEAIQAAYELLADLDRMLTDEVHASRATRRKATT